MQRYNNLSDIVVGDHICFDNKGRFYHGLPFEALVGEVVEVCEEDIIKVKFDLSGEHVTIELPYYLAQ